MEILTSLKGLIKYQWLLQELVIRDLKIKYRRSVLGYLWSILNPLMMMAVLTVVFSNMFRFDIPSYPVYLLVGQLVYSFYAESTGMAMDSILYGASLIKKVYLPKYIFPFSRVLSCFTTMIFSLIALIVVMLVMNLKFYSTLIMVPVVLFYILVFCVGMGLILSVLVVFFRDIKHLYGVFLTALNYLTPIFYPANLLPEWLRKWLFLNPLYDYIDFFRNVAIYGKWPTMTDHLTCIAFSLGTLAVGLYIFKKKQNEFILYI